MKRVVTILPVFFILCFAAKAQTEQAMFYVGASSNFDFLTQNLNGVDNNSNQLNLDLTGGYFVVDDFLLGVELDYDRTWADNDYIGSVGFGPIARYYYNFFFAGASFLYHSQNAEISGMETDQNGSSLNFEVGYAAFLNDNIAIEPSVFYGLGMGNLYEESSRFGIDIGFALYL